MWLGAALAAVSVVPRPSAADLDQVSHLRPLQLAIGPAGGVSAVLAVLDRMLQPSRGPVDPKLANASSFRLLPPLMSFALDSRQMVAGASFHESAAMDSRYLYLAESALKPVALVFVSVGNQNGAAVEKIRTGGIVNLLAQELGTSSGNAQFATERQLPPGPYEARFVTCLAVGTEQDEIEAVWFKSQNGGADYICPLVDTPWGELAGKLLSTADFQSKLVGYLKNLRSPAQSTNRIASQN